MAALELKNTTLFYDTSLTHYYQFEGNSNDAKGAVNGSDANITYNSSYGKYGQGASFNGTTSTINLGTSIDLTGKDFTLMTWAAKTLDANDRDLYFVHKANSTGNWLRMYVNNASKLKLEFYNIAITATNALPDSNYHFLVATFNNSTKQATLYVDGAQENQQTLASGPSVSSWNNVIGGYYDGSFVGSWNKYIDDFAIFERVLTSTEISNHYNGLDGFGASFLFNLV